MEEFLKSINREVKDIFKNKIETTNAYTVPTRDDQGLTFTIGSDKKGKTIETCVLMIDIRNSTKISKQLSKDKEKLGKIYSAFIYAMAQIADKYGYVRNIIGDRLMVVFEPKDCFENAVKCASIMYTVARKIITPLVAMDDFKVGIGIEFGEMLVLKAGTRKLHEEQSEYKNLVWIGDAANIASKLADLTNKHYTHYIYRIGYLDTVFEQKLIGFSPNPNATQLQKITGRDHIPTYRVEAVEKTLYRDLTANEFFENVHLNNTGWVYNGNKVTSINKDNRSGSTAVVLVSGRVLAGLKKDAPQSTYIKKFNEAKYPHAPSTGTGIYSAYLMLDGIEKMKLD